MRWVPTSPAVQQSTTTTYRNRINNKKEVILCQNLYQNLLILYVKDSINTNNTTNINDKSNIDSYLKEKYKIILGEELEDCSILEDNHWVYSTNKSNVFVHIESLLEIK